MHNRSSEQSGEAMTVAVRNPRQSEGAAMPLIGETIKGTYQICEKIGQGDAATVYLARDLAQDRDVALKVIHPHLAGEGRFLERFHLEAELLSQVRSDHVVQIYDYGKENDINYIVMEYVQGEALSDSIKRTGPLDVPAALRITRQIVECLGVISAQGIVHRNIKPANIMVTPRRQVKIMDFGIAKGLVDTGLTQSGVLGTPYYISPEQAEGDRKLDVRSDIYSVGVMLFEMLAGRVPYEDTNPMAVIMKHLASPIPSIREVRQDVPDGVEDLITKCLAKDPERRFQNPEGLIAALDQIQPPESPAVAVATVPVAVWNQIEQLTGGMSELRGRLDLLESQPPPPSTPVTRPVIKKIPGWVPIGLLVAIALAILSAILGTMLPRPPGETAPAELSAQVADEVARQIEARLSDLPTEENPVDISGQVAAEVARQVEAKLGEVLPAVTPDLSELVSAEMNEYLDQQSAESPSNAGAQAVFQVLLSGDSMTGNSLANGGFESALDGWILPGAQYALQAEVTNTCAFAGQAGLLLRGPDDNYHAGPGVSIAVEAGRFYAVGAMVKRMGEAAKIEAMYYAGKDAAGASHGVKGYDLGDLTGDWQPIVRVFQAPEWVTGSVVFHPLLLSGQGPICVDAVFFVPWWPVRQPRP